MTNDNDGSSDVSAHVVNVASDTNHVLQPPKCSTNSCFVCWLETQVGITIKDFTFDRNSLKLNLVGVRRENSLNDEFDDALLVIFRQLPVGSDALTTRSDPPLLESVLFWLEMNKQKPKIVKCDKGGRPVTWVVARFRISTDPGMEARWASYVDQQAWLEQEIVLLKDQKERRKKYDDAHKHWSDATKKMDDEKKKLQEQLQKQNLKGKVVEPPYTRKRQKPSNDPLQSFVDDIKNTKDTFEALQIDINKNGEKLVELFGKLKQTPITFKNANVSDLDDQIKKRNAELEKLKNSKKPDQCAVVVGSDYNPQIYVEDRDGKAGWYAEGRGLMLPGQATYRFGLHGIGLSLLPYRHPALILQESVPASYLFTGHYARTSPLAGEGRWHYFLTPRRAIKLTRNNGSDIYGFGYGPRNKLPRVLAPVDSRARVSISLNANVDPVEDCDTLVFDDTTLGSATIGDVAKNLQKYVSKEIKELKRGNGIRERFHRDDYPFVTVTRSSADQTYVLASCNKKACPQREKGECDPRRCAVVDLTNDVREVTFPGEVNRTVKVTAKAICAMPKDFFMREPTWVLGVKFKGGKRANYKKEAVSLEVGWYWPLISFTFGPKFVAFLEEQKPHKVTILDDEDLIYVDKKIDATNIHRGHYRPVPTVESHSDENACNHPDEIMDTPSESTRVKHWSEGCQVFPGFEAFNLFIRLCGVSRRFYCSDCSRAGSDDCKVLELGSTAYDEGEGGTFMRAHRIAGLSIDEEADSHQDYGGVSYRDRKSKAEYLAGLEDGTLPQDEEVRTKLTGERDVWRKKYIYDLTALYRFDFFRRCDYLGQCPEKFIYNLIEMESLDGINRIRDVFFADWDGSFVVK